MNAVPVLYVEDEPLDAYFMTLAFQKAGVLNPLEIVSDGEQAIHYLEGSGSFADRSQYPLPGLILLDLNLPRVSGLEVLQWIRRQPQFQSLPVVIYSSSNNALDVARTRELGIQDYLVKPSDPLELAKQVTALKSQWLG